MVGDDQRGYSMIKPKHRRIFDAVARTASSLKRDRRFADSPLEGDGFELVWGFSCQVVVLVFAGSLFGAGKPFFVPSPAVRFAERAEGVKGPKRQQSLAACRLSVACVSQRLDA